MRLTEGVGPMSETDDLDPVTRSRLERKRRWRERQEPDLDDYRYRFGGHYWDRVEEDMEPPEWWQNLQPNHPEITGPERDTESGPIPPEIDWSDLTAYRCKHCSQGCINPIGSEPAENRECRSCLVLPV